MSTPGSSLIRKFRSTTGSAKIKAWVKRKTNVSTVVRVGSVVPTNRQAYAIRLLLFHQKGPRNWEELKTVDGEVKATFAAAAQALGLLASDAIWERTMKDADIEMVSSRRFQRFFALLLFHCRPVQADELLMKFLDRLSPPRIGRTVADRRSDAFRGLPSTSRVQRQPPGVRPNLA
ncbi:hypothetical protein L596_004363 [Steinernema carpocapsae]|uniref:Uncharacterized protein n=1 Tax=Steinernema carpocapsae TaxID=34508 RepID=A0A4U8UZP1_STECR|nr:hypothetical protein L596_004363 [Steinernema carpocapsae]